MSKQTIDGIDYYERISDAEEAFAVRVPKGYPSQGKYKVLMLVHGRGELSPGTVENLKNVVLGFDYDGAGPLPRQYAIMTPEAIANADRTNTILVIVTYPNEFNPNDFDYVLDQVELNYQVDRTREFIIGFSLGGGAVLRNITSSAVAARRLAGAFTAAPVNWAGNLQYVADAKLQLVGVTYETDPTVPSANIKGIIAKLNSLNPEVPGYLKVYPGNAHGGLNELLSSREFWDYIEQATTENRLKYPVSGSGTGPVIPPPVVGLPVPEFNIKDGQVITTPEFTLDGSASKGAAEFYWEVNREEAPWIYPILVGGTVGGPLKTVKNLVNGKYSARLTINKSFQTSLRKFTVKLDGTQSVPKTLVGFDSATDLITWSDGSTEAGKVVYSGGKWVLKDSKGVIVQ